ncbi:MAG TPA: 4-hydroxy-3-methylbut-2-enyl diphosphate reductase [Bacteroidales bacterium]|nr:4-hydroxy-3-methylbut-2-enyl diphosphate reductase [Bacteroidales bacterium]
MKVTIDEKSGFCNGVVIAISHVEEELKKSGHLYCLGQIVHNNVEVERLEKMGLETINYEQFKQLKDCKVLIRAHGEPPLTYQIAKQNNIELIDASCKVVLKLQERIRNEYNNTVEKAQIVIYGKKGHAEVNGLIGQTGGDAIVVSSDADLENIDYTKPAHLYSQTTMSIEGFQQLADKIRQRMQQAQGKETVALYIHDTICRQVSNRAPHLRQFSKDNDVIIFVSGRDSSNGKVLYEECRQVNANTHFVSDIADIQSNWFVNKQTVGICGATSTPMWLMEKVATFIAQIK